MRHDRRSDQRRYNAPTCSEVTMVFVNDDSEPVIERDVRIYPHNPQFNRINILSPNLEFMTYGILYPYGELVWQPNWRCDGYQQFCNAIIMLQFKVTQTAIRNDFNNGGLSTRIYK